MRFTSPPSADVLSDIRRLPYRVEVHTGAALAWQDLELAGERLFTAVADQAGIATAVTAEIDPVTDAITVTYRLESGAARSAADIGSAAMATANPTLPTDMDRVTVNFRHDRTLSGGTARVGSHPCPGTSPSCHEPSISRSASSLALP